MLNIVCGILEYISDMSREARCKPGVNGISEISFMSRTEFGILNVLGKRRNVSNMLLGFLDNLKAGACE